MPQELPADDLAKLTEAMKASFFNRDQESVDPATIEYAPLANLAPNQTQETDGAGIEQPASPSLLPGEETPAHAETANGAGLDASTVEQTSLPEGVSPAARIVIDGQEVELTEQQLRDMLALTGWAQGFTPEQAAQIGAIERGAALAVPADEYAQFRAWQQNPAARATPTEPEWLEDLDPEARDQFAQLQAEVNALRASQSRHDSTPAIEAQMRAADAAAAEFQTAIDAYADEHGYTAEQADAFVEAAVASDAITKFVQAGRRYSPTGTLIAEADFDTVARKAIEFGRVLLGADQPAPAIDNEPTAPVVDMVARKKSRAASLAAAPSAATPMPSVDVRNLSPQDTRELMASMLRQAATA